MTLKIEQGFDYQGDDSWDWWVWLDGSEEDLDRVDHVVYILHPTFPKPVRKITNRSTKFLLKTSGWGVFKIQAKVIDKDGKETLLKHFLVLEYPDGTATTC
jgi:transcription initiation factor IIF auxiliary subunit